MRKIIGFLLVLLMVISSISALEIDLNINVENPAPQLWISDYTITPDDRDGYAISGFPGETIKWNFLARSLNGDEKISEVFYEINNILTGNCYYTNRDGYVDFADTNFNPSTDKYGICEFTVRDYDYGDSEIKTVVEDILGNQASASFNIFLNPQITLSTTPLKIDINGYAGQTSLLSQNIDLDVEGGANAKISIKGTDFYDSRSAPTKCPSTNQFSLTNIKYSVDGNNFLTIPYIATPIGIYNNDFELTFQVNIPSPCIGSFDSGSIFIIGEIV